MSAYRFIVDCFKVFLYVNLMESSIASNEVLMSRKQFNICKQLSTTDKWKEKE